MGRCASITGSSSAGLPGSAVLNPWACRASRSRVPLPESWPSLNLHLKDPCGDAIARSPRPVRCPAYPALDATDEFGAQMESHRRQAVIGHCQGRGHRSGWRQER
jgi:hypothetical protein